MPGIIDPSLAAPRPPGPGFSVSHQNVHLDIDFLKRQVRGRTEITIQPHYKDLKTVRLNCRQCVLTRLNVKGRSANVTYNDPYERLNLHSSVGVHQHHLLRKRLEGQLRYPPEEELVINLPKSVRIEELDPFSAAAGDVLLSRLNGGGGKRSSAEPATAVETPMTKPDDGTTLLTPLKITIEFYIEKVRDGLQFVGVDQCDSRYPHVYSTNSKSAGMACSLFPCLDDPLARCTWEISIKCPRTLGDAFAQPDPSPPGQSAADAVNLTNGSRNHATISNNEMANDSGAKKSAIALSEDEKALDLAVVCTGNMTDEASAYVINPSRKTVHFACTTPVSPQHIGIAVGPFENVELSEFRESDEDEKLGQNAVHVHAFCLPGRAEEVKNSCMFMAKAVDHFVLTYGSYPFSSYKLCFVDDLPTDVADTASLSLCSNRLLYPEDILDPIDEVTRTFVHALASQWLGINIIAKEPVDTWIIIACSYFMTDIFLEDLFGRNDFRYRQRVATDKLCELDFQRPSVYELGSCAYLDQSELEFLKLKAPLILFMLHQRLAAKAATKLGVNRIIWRLCLNAKTGDLQNGAVTTAYFLRVSEKAAHGKLDVFFNQWVYGAGCPQFNVTQRFNKKKLIVEMLIKQVQGERADDQHVIEPQSFRREVKEEQHNIHASPIQPLFTGPMTIRIHEADGTPYEHIVDINEVSKKVEIPYNTKYKRLKRSRRQRERFAAASGLEMAGDAQDDALLYCLGDVLQSEQEVADWKLSDWSREDEDRMSQESYEWIRVDAEFEWLAKISFNMPQYMYVSQLQQDRDVVAQLESIQYLGLQKPDILISSILVRTLMDRRYYHGIRTAAAFNLAKCATNDLQWIGLFHLEKAFQVLYCFPNSSMTRSNDFSDRISYIIQCTIPKAIAQVQDSSGKAPARVKTFFADKLKFNDNSNNRCSDCYYISTLLTCLADALIQKRTPSSYTFSFDDDDDAAEQEATYTRDAVSIIERYGRIDEWIPSYNNVQSTTAMDCMRRLMENNVIDRRPVDFVQYSRIGNLDLVRIKAFDCLTRLDMLQNSAFKRYILGAIENDPSPYARREICRIFWLGLGLLVLTEAKQPGNGDMQIEQHGNLIIEQEVTAESRQQNLAKIQSVPAALEALKSMLGNDESLKEGLRGVLSSELTSLQEFGEFLELCQFLYVPITSLIVKLKYPRYWQVKHIDNGKLHFTKTSKVRTATLAKIQAPPNPNPKPKPPPISLIIRRPSVNATSDGQGASITTPQILASPASATAIATVPATAATVSIKTKSSNIPAPRFPTPHPHPPQPSSTTSTPSSMSTIKPPFQKTRTILKLSTKSLATLKPPQQQANPGSAQQASIPDPTSSSTDKNLHVNPAANVDISNGTAVHAVGPSLSMSPLPPPISQPQQHQQQQQQQQPQQQQHQQTQPTAQSPSAQPKIPKLKLRMGSFNAGAGAAAGAGTGTTSAAATGTAGSGQGLKRKSNSP